MALSPAHADVVQVAAPLGYKVFCLSNPGECRPTAARGGVQASNGRVTLTAARALDLDTVNQAINARIAPRQEQSGLDRWQPDAPAGDCEDYALAKQRALIRMGWPSSATLLSKVRTPRGVLHVVLLVRTDRGDFVLDNLSKSVEQVGAIAYRWESMQSSDDPLRWQHARGTGS